MAEPWPNCRWCGHALKWVEGMWRYKYFRNDWYDWRCGKSPTGRHGVRDG